MNASAATPAAPLSDPSPLQVLLVCSRGEHLQSVRSLASRWPQAAHIHWTPDPEEAMRRARSCPPHLAILDARLDRACDRWLSEGLRRDRPDLVVMNFDEEGRPAAHGRSSHWHWSELPRATAWWVQRHFGVRPPVQIQ
jgi:hypothetical protein